MAMCPDCESMESHVTDTRHRSDGVIRRRRQCVNGHRYSTKERTDRAIKSRPFSGQRDLAADEVVSLIQQIGAAP